MKVVILAGGLGSRLSEYTKKIPKPMVKIGNEPLISHIIKLYIKYGFNDFIVAGGYKYKIIENYFNNYKNKKIKIRVVNTGLNALTGSRILKLKKYLNNETFMMTYGDGVSNVNLKKLLSFHKKNKKIATLTAVRPPARFGALKISGSKVKYFKEKSKLDEGWINGGFFVLEPKIFDFIENDQTYLEREPLEKLTKKNQLSAYKHKSFWQCMDTKRDKDKLEQLLKKNY